MTTSVQVNFLSGYDSVREFKVTGVIMDLVHLPDERGVGSDIFIHCCGYVRACVRLYTHITEHVQVVPRVHESPKTLKE